MRQWPGGGCLTSASLGYSEALGQRQAVRDNAPWAASWLAGLGTAGDYRKCRKNMVWLPPKGALQLLLPA